MSFTIIEGDVVVRDADGNAAGVTTDGRLSVSTAPNPPTGATTVSQGYTGNVSGTDNQFYTIPVGEQLYIQRFAGGGEFKGDGSKAELYWAPNGTTAGIVLIRVGYVNGSNFEFNLDYTAPAVGDGTAAILTRRRRLSGGTKEIAAFWDGFTQ